MSLKVIETGAI